ncbi:MAG: four helix bundle protein [Alphaproteobacteria bacterium]|nr:four helix bundle protein [Alphaproteobacteria bacterium]
MGNGYWVVERIWIMAQIASYRDLRVWQAAMDLAEATYRLTRKMPRHEEYRLSSQLIRATASVPANIAEGFMRGTRKDYANFISIARGSLAETETFLLLIGKLELVPSSPIEHALAQADTVGRMLTKLRQSLAAPKSPST